MKISIVTPSFNQGRFLEQTMRSVLDQNYPDLEYIVIDGGSTDNSVDIIKKYADRLAYWVSEPDKGHYAAVNKGFTHATGDIFFFLNSDDILVPGSLSIVNEIFAEFPDIHWISGIPSFWDEQGRLISVAERVPIYNRVCVSRGEHDARILSHIQQESCFWRKWLWEKTGGINTTWDLAGDFELWTRMAGFAELVTVCTVLSGQRKHPEQRGGKQFRESFEQADRICANLSYRRWLRSSFFGKLRSLPGGYAIFRMFLRRRGTILEWENYPSPHWTRQTRQVF